MDHSQPVSRYQVLNNEDDSPEESPHTEPPPSIQEVSSGGAAILVGPEVPPPYSTGEEYFFQSDFPLASAPPPYSIATSLPTYDEAEKAAAMATSVANMGEFPPWPAFSEAHRMSVGNDRMFIVAFFVAFLFNWIGFCLSFCLTNTMAGRCGALSGFGLSLVKWIFVFKFFHCFDQYIHGQYWLWWIFITFGFLLFFRGIVNHLKVRNLPENMLASSRIRFYFLY